MTNLRIISSYNSSAPRDFGDVGDLDQLHAISTDLIGEQDVVALYGKIVDAAISITRSQFGTMQVLRKSEDGSGYGLHLLASQGLTPQDQAVW